VRALYNCFAMRTVFLVFFFVSSCFADLRYRIETTGRQAGDTDRIVYVQGQRMRTDAMKTGRVTIRECDLNRIVRLDPATRTYRIVPILPLADAPPPQSSPVSGPEMCRGTFRRQVEETGTGEVETKPMPTMRALHLKIWIYSDPVPDSCSVPNRRSFLAVVRDGWYVAVQDIPECPARTETDRLGLDNFDAPDRYTRTDGSSTSELLPFTVKVQVPHGQQLETMYTAQVTEFSTEPMDPKLFDIPSDYQPAAAPDCSKTGTVVGNLEDGTPVYSYSLESGTCGFTAPRVTYRVEPEYTERARKKQISGTVVVSAIVDLNGKVRDVKVERSLEPTMDQAAANTLSTWKFEPAMKDGQRVAVRLKVEMSFQLFPGPRH
jgi:TonB family protein